MVARAANASDSSRRPAEAEQLRPVRETVVILDRLLKVLFPEPISLDIITVENVVSRYPLTGLGAPALAAIEQSQRIVRARGNNGQIGLGEFHIGLIFLHWDDCRAAANQFAVARQPWSLANDYPAMCLAHYAQGLGLYHSYHNEAAMLQFGRAERLLGRPAVGAQAERFAALSEEMRSLLRIAQETLRESLWPREQAATETLKTGYLTVPPQTPRGADQPQRADESPRPADQSAARPEWTKRVPLPISNLPGGLSDAVRGPVPGHITTDDRFGWYMIAEKKGSFLPAVTSGTWLLADREVDERLSAGREYVIIGSNRAGLGGITVQPVSHSSAVRYCYLGYRVPDEAAPSGARLFLDETGRPPETEDVLVLAVVEGFWYELNGHALPIS
jgi:hypothetical protein